MKKLTIVVIVIAGLALLIPIAVGLQTETRLAQSVVDANTQAGPYAHLTLEDYQRGWFSSEGKLRLRFNDEVVANNPAMQTEEFKTSAMGSLIQEGFVQDVHVKHGPLFIEDSVELGLGRMTSVIDGSLHPNIAELLDATGNTYLVRGVIDIGFSGIGEISLDAPSFQYNAADSSEADLTFAGAQAHGQLDFSNMHLVLDAKMNGFSLANSETEMVIETTRFTTDTTYPENAPYALGNGEFKMDRMLILDNNLTSLDVAGVQASFNTAQTSNENISIQVRYDIGTLNSGNNRLKDVQLNMNLQDVSATALVALQTLGNTTETNQNDPAAILKMMSDSTYDMIAGGMTLRVDPVQFTYNDRPLRANISLASKPAALPDRDVFQLDNPALLMSLFSVSADLLLHRELAIEMALPQVKQQLIAGIPENTEVDEAELNRMAEAQVPLMMGALVGQGILREDGENYSVNAKFDQSQLHINGNPFPLGAFMNTPQ